VELSALIARQQIEHLWLHTGALRDDIRRAAFPLDRDRAPDATRGWDRTTIVVDHEPTEFAYLASGEHWVAQAIIEPLVVGLTAFLWPVEAVGLRAETTFDQYVDGRKELRRRRP
jgi:hypothetical protein